MDLVFIGGIAVLWAAVAGLVMGLDRLSPRTAPMQGERS